MGSVYSKDSKALSAGNRIAFKWAAIVAIFSIVVTLIGTRFIRSDYGMFAASYYFIGLVSIGLYFMAGVEHSKALGRYISLKEVFRTIFLVIVLSSVVITIWDILYFTLFDKALPQKILEGSVAYLKSQHAPQERIDQEIERGTGGFTAGAALLVAARLIVIKSIFGMMSGFVIKRQPPAQPL